MCKCVCACAVLSLIDQLWLRALPPQNPHWSHGRFTTGLIALLVLSVPVVHNTSEEGRRKRWRLWLQSEGGKQVEERGIEGNKVNQGIDGQEGQYGSVLSLYESHLLTQFFMKTIYIKEWMGYYIGQAYLIHRAEINKSVPPQINSYRFPIMKAACRKMAHSLQLLKCKCSYISWMSNSVTVI